ncbi:Hsp20/alpha crystallin family protein [Aequorivita sp. F47161]|jgi:HSP20 family protein|uniref:Hsp20/alpha crystallin family protein n=1 Tax=Aequorivita vitellina TaxID=2874475 RepID=A0A9X1QXE5_9FLAO|nr:Hsp20/alpha crystallin family protein [Aequorivita vitellina]MCG2419641.1 Hsp20/alpha crystallin family protein [Aequorivita vitellina]MCZ4320047.1 Hsp20/alpha crystallin family protein [Aequorivita viscosa]
MKTVNKDSVWLPGLIDNFLFDNKLDTFTNNYETFSIPAVNISENLTNFAIEIAVPGFKKENFTIEAEEDTLKVSSKTIETAEESNKETRYTRREFNYNKFERSFTLPENVKTEDIEAKYENGVLKITLPKLEEKKVLKKMVEIS